MKLNWGYSLILFFVIFVSLMIAFIVFSLRQNNDLVTDDYYEKGAGYTSQMEINSRSAIYSDSIRIMSQGDKISASFAKSINQQTDSIQLYFYRPSDKKSDFRIKVLLDSDTISIENKNLNKGRYIVTFDWKQGNQLYQIQKELFID